VINPSQVARLPLQFGFANPRNLSVGIDSKRKWKRVAEFILLLVRSSSQLLSASPFQLEQPQRAALCSPERPRWAIGKGDAPGVRRKITVADLPPPSSNILAINRAHVVERPAGAQLRVPPGFTIEWYVGCFRDPRFLLTAPNGDIFVVESRADRIKVLRDTKHAGKPDVTEIFAEQGLNKPFGIAFYPPVTIRNFCTLQIPMA
jgi:glucose/arabinose dehydrogenase